MQSPVPTRIALGEDTLWWSGLTAEGLLTVTPQSLTSWSWDGARRDVRPEVSPERAAVVAVFETPAFEGSRQNGLWLLVGAGTRPQALDARTGARVWGVPGSDSRALEIETLTGVGDQLVVVNGLGPVVHETRTGHVRAACRRVTGRLAGWHLFDQRLYGLYVSPGFVDPVGELVRVPLGGGRTEAWTLVPTGRVRQVAWTGAFMLVLENHALRAYRLP